MDSRVGQTVSHYRIAEKLGGGGMGVVYRAVDLRLERPVALKFLPPELTRDEQAKQRFIREAKLASSLEHRHICAIHDIDETPDGQMFICMAYYDGATLKERLDDGPVPVEEAVRIASEIADGLQRAHECGIVHRDLKPANVMLNGDGEVKIVDFGLAKLSGSTRITRSGVALGTLFYMSPEQARGEACEPRSDIFSLGVTLYEMLAGKAPFIGDHDAAVVYQMQHVDPDPVSKYRSDVGNALDRVVMTALAKRPQDRYVSAAAFKYDLQATLSGGRLRGVIRRRHRLAFAGSVLTLVLAGLVGWFALDPPSWMPRLQVSGGSAPQHLVVLPFTNVGGEEANVAFCDGLTETLTSQLSQLERFHADMWVVPASEIRNRDLSTPTGVRKAFPEVNLVFTGAVQRIENSFRVTLTLIDIDRNEAPHQLSSAMIDDRLSNVAVLQDEAVIRAARMLNLELSREAHESVVAGGTENDVAFDAYLVGKGYLQRYEKRDNVERAIASFERAIDADSRYALAHAGLGEAYWRMYRIGLDTRWVEPALESCKRALDLNSVLAPVHVTLGMVYAGTGSPAEALTAFQRALALDPTSADAYRGMAQAQAALGNRGGAEATYRRAIQMKPVNWAGYNDLGVFYYREGRYAEAAEQFERVVELTPDNVLGYTNLGASYWATGRIEEARRAFEGSLEVEPNYRAYNNLGILHYQEGRYAEAAAMGERALEINDTSYNTWANLANTYYWWPGHEEEAAAAYRRAAELAEAQLEVNPGDAHLLTSLAGYYAMLGDRSRVRRLLATALGIAPDNPRVAYFAGHAYEQIGMREEALEWIGQAIDHGYPPSEVETDPWLGNLRSDERFGSLRTTAPGAE